MNYDWTAYIGFARICLRRRLTISEEVKEVVFDNLRYANAADFLVTTAVGSIIIVILCRFTKKYKKIVKIFPDNSFFI